MQDGLRESNDNLHEADAGNGADFEGEGEDGDGSEGHAMAGPDAEPSSVHFGSGGEAEEDDLAALATMEESHASAMAEDERSAAAEAASAAVGAVADESAAVVGEASEVVIAASASLQLALEVLSERPLKD
jgi:hypothetical protein